MKIFVISITKYEKYMKFRVKAALIGDDHMNRTEQNRTDYLFDVNYTVSSQSNTIIIYISRSQILSEYLNQVVVLI